ncbi:MAG: hypothetical protein DRN65_07025, partial [Thaumarchaeota archaeon]
MPRILLLLQPRPLGHGGGEIQLLDHSRANLNELERIFGLIGVKINSSVPCRDLTEIKRMGNADLNVVLGYGTLLAKKMEESFGIPYI